MRKNKSPQYILGVDWAKKDSEYSAHALIRSDPDGCCVILHAGVGLGGIISEVERDGQPFERRFSVTCENCLDALLPFPDGAKLSVVMESKPSAGTARRTA